jgi:hypothetical protein
LYEIVTFFGILPRLILRVPYNDNNQLDVLNCTQQKARNQNPHTMMLSKVPFLRKAELSALETAFADGFFL